MGAGVAVPQGETPPCPQQAARPHPPISGRAAPILGHAGPQALTPPRRRCCSGLPLRRTAAQWESTMPHRFVVFSPRVPSALGMALAPPSTAQDDSPSSVWMRCWRFEPEDGRLRYRNHAPQEVIMFNELRRQVALHGVLGRAIVTRVPTGSVAQARRHLIPESDRGPPRPERQEPSKSHVFGSKRVW